MSEQLCVCDFGIKAIMLQVFPGTEAKVASIFSEELERLKKQHHIFKVLGNYDLFVIYESSGFTPDVINIGSIPHILKSNELLCFPWEIREKTKTIIKDGLNFRNFEQEILGFSFLKISPDHIRRAGTDVEQALISFFKNQKNMSILGSFGWNELIVLVHGNSIEETYNTLIDVSGLTITYGPPPGGNKSAFTREPLFLKTLSFIGINFKLLEMLQEKPNHLKSTLNERISANFIPQIYLACCPEFMNYITSEASEYFGPVHLTLGAEDLNIFNINKNKIRTWGDFLTKVYKFREANKSKLFSTSIRINKKEKTQRNRRIKQSQDKISSPPISISKKEALIIKEKFGTTFQMWLLNTLYTYNNLMQNNIAKDAFIDMVPFAKRIKSMALSGDCKIQEINYVEHFIFGAQQRASSIYSGIDNIEYRFSAFKGGIQRVLQALELLPMSMLENFGLTWHGIINAGEDDTYRSDLDLLNIPIDYLFSPKDWWGLFHEIGHVATFYSEILELDEKRLGNFIKKVQGLSEGTEDYNLFMNLCWEISSDIFDYKFGFASDLETYLSTVWEYLEKDYFLREGFAEQDLMEHLFRSFTVYLYDIFFSEDKNVSEFSKEKNMKTHYESFINYLNELKKRKSLSVKLYSDEIHNKIISSFSILKPFLLHLHDKYVEIHRRKSPTKNASKKEIEKIMQTLIKGQVYWNEIKNPEIIIYRLRKENISNLKVNIATILSFWNTFHLRYGKNLYEMTFTNEG